jgi:hypothetical protein
VNETPRNEATLGLTINAEAETPRRFAF